jgi:hypothetical protein
MLLCYKYCVKRIFGNKPNKDTTGNKTNSYVNNKHNENCTTNYTTIVFLTMLPVNINL